MFVFKDFVPDSFVAQICAISCARAHFGAYLRDEVNPEKSLNTNIGTIPKNMPTNFELKRFKTEARYRQKTWKSSA